MSTHYKYKNILLFVILRIIYFVGLRDIISLAQLSLSSPSHRKRQVGVGIQDHICATRNSKFVS